MPSIKSTTPKATPMTRFIGSSLDWQHGRLVAICFSVQRSWGAGRASDERFPGRAADGRLGGNALRSRPEGGKAGDPRSLLADHRPGGNGDGTPS